jgi:hypothetical protein
MESLLPKVRPSMVKDIADAVMYLTDTATVTWHILRIDCGARPRRSLGTSCASIAARGSVVEKRLAPGASRASVRDTDFNSRRV